MIRVLTAALIYFAIVFGVGFVLGLVRVPLLVPTVGERAAELIEMPFMLIAIYFAARRSVERFRLGPSDGLLTGILAAAALLAVEFTVVLWIRGLDISEFLAERDPVAGAAYYLAVIIFALMPAGISFSRHRRRNNG